MKRSDAVSRLQSLLTNKPFREMDESNVEYFGAIVGGDSPSGFSRSPWLWNRFFEEAEISALFTSFDLPEEESFEAFAHAAGSIPELIDLTVTSPT